MMVIWLVLHFVILLVRLQLLDINALEEMLSIQEFVLRYVVMVFELQANNAIKEMHFQEMDVVTLVK